MHARLRGHGQHRPQRRGNRICRTVVLQGRRRPLASATTMALVAPCHISFLARRAAKTAPTTFGGTHISPRNSLLELLALIRSLGDQVYSLAMKEPPEIQFQDLLRQPARSRDISRGSKHAAEHTTRGPYTGAHSRFGEVSGEDPPRCRKCDLQSSTFRPCRRTVGRRDALERGRWRLHRHTGRRLLGAAGSVDQARDPARLGRSIQPSLVGRAKRVKPRCD